MQAAKARFVPIQFIQPSAEFHVPFDDCCMHASLFISSRINPGDVRFSPLSSQCADAPCGALLIWSSVTPYVL
jgi:hypothetical protein